MAWDSVIQHIDKSKELLFKQIKKQLNKEVRKLNKQTNTSKYGIEWLEV